MLSLGPLAFLSPWLLGALLALPLLWLLLRATPPSPRLLRFPGVRLLLGLQEEERTPDRTPWWLLLLRCLIAALVVLAFAQPILNPRARLSADGPLLVLLDGGWASAPDWAERQARALEALAEAERAGRAVSVVSLARPAPEDAAFDLRPAADWRGEVEALRPAPWAPLRAAFAERLAEAPFAETLWIADGLAHEEEALAEALAALGPLAMVSGAAPAPALQAPRLEDGALVATALRAMAGAEVELGVVALGGVGLELPLELRNKIERLALIGVDSAGAAALADEGVRRRRAGLVSGGAEEAGRRLLADLHYLRSALQGRAALVEGEIGEVLEARPDILFLADVGRFTEAERAALESWVESGGLLVRFAGPRLAGGPQGPGAAGFAAEDPLLPTPLRVGGRAVGGAMSWGEPQRIRGFAEDSPFAGLAPPEDVTVSRQVLARLGPDLPQKVWATLADGTPLVTADERGAGRVALFHVTANADWSNLPLSGLYVDMIGRLVAASGAGGGVTAEAALEGLTARPLALLDGFGRLEEAESAGGFPAERLADRPGPDAPPGFYEVGDAVRAHNLFRPGDALAPAPPPPAGAALETLDAPDERPLAPWLLAAALALFALDLLAALALSGRLPRLGRGAAAAVLALTALGLGLALGAPEARAQDAPGPERVDEQEALRASIDTVLAYVRTGDPQTDRLSEAGLLGLSRVLAARTSVEPAPPLGVDLETDELGFYPVLYWPVTTDQPRPSDEAAAKLNAYMRSGGMIVFDTRDRHQNVGGAGPGQSTLRRLAGALDLPPLEPAPRDHVLTRTFYLLQEFPGRFSGGRVWVEASPDPGELEPGQAFRSLKDGVSPVIVGDADWAGAWAIGEDGDFLAPIAAADGWRRREMAYRFGVNLVMYALTGNYKSDQVHVPALLERLGQ